MIYSNRVHPDSKQVFDKEYYGTIVKKFIEFIPQQCFYINYKIKIVDRRQTLLNLLTAYKLWSNRYVIRYVPEYIQKYLAKYNRKNLYRGSELVI